MTNSHLFSDHLKRSYGGISSINFSSSSQSINTWNFIKANRTTGIRYRQRGSSLISEKEIPHQWEGENIYDAKYQPLRIINLAGLNYTGNNTERGPPHL